MNAEQAQRRRAVLWRKRLRLERVFKKRRGGYSGWVRAARRDTLTTGLKLAGLYGRGQRNALAVTLAEHAWAFPALPAAFDGFRILFLSDLHFGDADDGARLAEIIATAPADLCLLGGDYPWGYGGPAGAFTPALEVALNAVDARHGVYTVLGNHDYSHHIDAIGALGVEPLINCAVPIERDGAALWLAGVDDPSHFNTGDLRAALHGVPRDAFTILLAHAPDRYHDAAGAGVDLYLCGHTHGGQIRLPLVGAPYLNSTAPRRFCAGPWTLNGMRGYTTFGIGTTDVPVRYGCLPEAVLITLRREEAPTHGA